MALLETPQKLRGGYYTPMRVAHFLARWAIHSAHTTVLEPSCGDGNISMAAAERLLQLGASPHNVATALTCIELDAEEAMKAAWRLRDLGVDVNENPVATDFFSFCHMRLLSNLQYDAIVGNPPFIRYHHFDERYRKVAFQIMQHAGLKPSYLTNIWVPFVVASTLLLSETGHLAMVIPAELLQVGYAADLRKFLAAQYEAITIVTFKKLIFHEAQQEVVLLLASRVAPGRKGIDVVELEDDDALNTFDFDGHDQHELKSLDHASEKWTQYFLSEGEVQLLRRVARHPAIVRFGDVASVDIGVVTGNNDFFALTANDVATKRLEGHTLPLVGRTVQLPGMVYGADDRQRDEDGSVRCHLLMPSQGIEEEVPDALAAYLSWGEALEVHRGYKCSIRKQWYVVPSVWRPDAFLFRQINRYPKLVANHTQATSTDTVHRVRFRDPAMIHPTIAAFHNSMTFAFTEVMGRSYGGGVLELEPNEADNLPLPPLSHDHILLETLDRHARAKEIEQVLDLTDQMYLRNALGLPQGEVDELRGVWAKLSQRRTSRTFRKRRKATDNG